MDLQALRRELEEREKAKDGYCHGGVAGFQSLRHSDWSGAEAIAWLRACCPTILFQGPFASRDRFSLSCPTLAWPSRKTPIAFSDLDVPSTYLS